MTHRGLGRIRHLDDEDRQFVQGRVELLKIASAENQADARMKHVDGPVLENMASETNVVPMEGRSLEAPQFPQE